MFLSRNVISRGPTPQALSAPGVSPPSLNPEAERRRPIASHLSPPWPYLSRPIGTSALAPDARPERRREGKKKLNKSFNDTDAILNEAVLQFTLNRTLTYYKCVIRRTIRFITPRVSFSPLMTMDAKGEGICSLLREALPRCRRLQMRPGGGQIPSPFVSP